MEILTGFLVWFHFWKPMQFSIISLKVAIKVKKAIIVLPGIANYFAENSGSDIANDVI